MNLTGGARNIHCSIRPTQGLSWVLSQLGVTRSGLRRYNKNFDRFDERRARTADEI